MRAADVAGAPARVTRRCCRSSATSRPAAPAGLRRRSRGMAVRIMTGAPLPPGADAVVPRRVDRRRARRRRRDRPRPASARARHIRRRGEDVDAPGTTSCCARRAPASGPRQLGLLAAVGRDRVRVRPRPRVVVLSTGSELVEPGAAAGPGQIHDSNSYAAHRRRPRGRAPSPFRVGIVAGRRRARCSTPLEDQLIRADLVSPAAGSASAPTTWSRRCSARLGTVRSTRSPCSPACRRASASIGPDQTPIFTLPGNPVSAYVSFEVFVRPVIRADAGRRAAAPAGGAGGAGRALSVARTGKRQFAARLARRRGRAATSCARSAGRARTWSARLAHANALIVVPEDVTEVAARCATVDGRWCCERRDRPDRSPMRAASPTSTRRGAARMVDVSGKDVTVRTATRHRPGRSSSAAVVALLRGGGVPKGDALAVARIAGIMARQAHPRPRAAVPPDRDPRRDGRPRRRRRRASRSPPPCGPRTAPASRWRR